MYRFEIIANTDFGQSVALVGSTPQLGNWDPNHSIPLRTHGDRYPLWSTEIALDFDLNNYQAIEYKYIIKDEKGEVYWEIFPENRRLFLEKAEKRTIIIDDGAFGFWQPYPFGYLLKPEPKIITPESKKGLKILVIGSSVALGYKAWLLKGWAELLGEELAKKHGHQLVNVSESGANVDRTIARFPKVVKSEKPDMVIIALSLGNEGLAYCQESEQKGIQRRFEAGIQELMRMTEEIGAIPILGGVYPHNYYNSAHYGILRETHQRMLTWGVPVLSWLDNLDDGKGNWRDDTSFDPAHPNSKGHQLMFEAIDLSIFKIKKEEVKSEIKKIKTTLEKVIYSEVKKLQLISNIRENSLTFLNLSEYNYGINADFEPLQKAIKQQVLLRKGLYLTKKPVKGILPFLEISPQGIIDTSFDLPPQTEVKYQSIVNWFASDVIFFDGQVAIFKENDKNFWVVNETSHEYNIHPMWKKVRNALKQIPAGVYEDYHFPDVPFRTAIIDPDGLASRIKLPPKSAVYFQYKCSLAEISRVGIIPLGARCAARMVLYKLGYDGPAYPFDLTRTTKVGDVADMIAYGFEDMWNPNLLHYNPDEHRIYHDKWTGLSFAHEVEDDEDPITDMSPIFQRMKKRYFSRSQRFWFTINQADELLFVRNSYCDRGGIIDLLEKLKWKCGEKRFRLLIISPQDSGEYTGLENVIHYNYDFNPDRMYEDQGYWDHCTGVMGHILQEIGVSSKNLFWCSV